MARIHPAATPSFSITDVIDGRDRSSAVLDQHGETTTIRVDLSS